MTCLNKGTTSCAIILKNLATGTYNNCVAYWEDVHKHIINPPPNDYDSPQSNYLPSDRPAQHCLCQIDVPELSEI